MGRVKYISREEYEDLTNLYDDGFRYISKDSDGDVFAHKHEPRMQKGAMGVQKSISWDSEDRTYVWRFTDDDDESKWLFEFLNSYDDPYEIEELLQAEVTYGNDILDQLEMTEEEFLQGAEEILIEDSLKMLGEKIHDIQIPYFAAVVIDENKRGNFKLIDSLHIMKLRGEREDKQTIEWLQEDWSREELFVKAWLFGYMIEPQFIKVSPSLYLAEPLGDMHDFTKTTRDPINAYKFKDKDSVDVHLETFIGSTAVSMGLELERDDDEIQSEIQENPFMDSWGV